MKNTPAFRPSRWIAAASLLCAATAFAQDLPANWSAERQADGGTIYRATGLPEDHLVHIWVLPPQPVGKLSALDAFEQLKTKYSVVGIKPDSRFHCPEYSRHDYKNFIVQNCEIHIKGLAMNDSGLTKAASGNVHLTFKMMAPRDGKVQFIRVASFGDHRVLDQRQPGGFAIIKAEHKRWEASALAQDAR
jgi:hypothetical protein